MREVRSRKRRSALCGILEHILIARRRRMPAASRKTAPTSISINRAPVLSLWAAVVAEQLGYDPDEAATLGEAVSVLNARSKGRRLGIFGPSVHEGGRDNSAAPSERQTPHQDEQLELLGRPVPVTRTAQGVRAMIGGEVLNPQRVRRKLEQKFGQNYPIVRDAMGHVARSFRPAELAAAAYGMYERFRPAVPAGTRGWGARGTLDPDFIRSLAKRPPTEHAVVQKGQQDSDRSRRDTHPDRNRPRPTRRRTHAA
jgi:hypothetical protein